MKTPALTNFSSVSVISRSRACSNVLQHPMPVDNPRCRTRSRSVPFKRLTRDVRCSDPYGERTSQRVASSLRPTRDGMPCSRDQGTPFTAAIRDLIRSLTSISSGLGATVGAKWHAGQTRFRWGRGFGRGTEVDVGRATELAAAS